MKHEILTNGDLLIIADNKSRACLADAYHHEGYCAAEMLISEAFHEVLTFIAPEDIGALTDAPILTDGADYSDEVMETGGPVPYDEANVWWFPNYMVTDPWEELKDRGRVVFTKVPNDS